MLFKVDPKIFKEFPGAVIGVVAAYDIKNSKSSKQVMDLLKQSQERISKKIKREDIKEHPHVAPWREAYRKFGAKPKKYLPSVENLVTRIAKGVPFGSVNTLVDLYNIVSINYLLPAGGEDIDTLKGNIDLTFAGDSEKEVVLLGDKEAKAPKPGEVIYKDDNGAICRRWNWKEADRTKLTENTTHAVLVLEGLPPISKEYVQDATNALATLIEEYCGGTATVALLEESNPEIRLKDGAQFIPLHPSKEIDFSDEPSIMTKEHVEQEQARSEEYQVRVDKTEKMQEAGLNPWPALKPVDANAAQIIEDFNKGDEDRTYEIAGRIMAMREHGKTIFCTLQDRSGTIQIYLKKDDIGEKAYKQFEQFVDIGDILWVRGTSFKTNMGEITLQVKEYSLQSKSLHPMPDKFHGLADVETKYRQRYLDLISNEESRDRFQKRSLIIRALRNYLDQHEFIEVETPMLHPIPGGAVAKPFITHHNTLDMELYLRIAPELYLKRLIVGGLERVYEINRCFRNEGISTRHNPEFTTVELYVAYKDYRWMMDFTEEMLRHVVTTVVGETAVSFGEHVLDFGKPFERISMHDAVVKYAGISEKDLSKTNIDAAMKKHKVSLDKKDASWGEKLYVLFDELVESKLIQPTFITHFPVEVSPLAKRDPENPDMVNRFEMFIGGMELANAFNELNDPFDQAERFKHQAVAKDAGDDEAHHYDADYITALEHAMPPTTGYGLGVDRLTMLLTNTTSIKDVILFPTLKKK